jgi:MGT family glycosyltransferase
MSTIVFAEMPAYGHVNPTVPVVRELVRRGEQVIYYDDEQFRSPTERAGAEFRAYPAGVLRSADIAAATQTGNSAKVIGVLLRATESLLPFILDELSRGRPDVVAFDSNALWGRMAATKLGLPTVSLMTTFMLTFSQFRQLSLREHVHLWGPILPSLPALIRARSRVIRRFGKALYPPQPTLPMRGDVTIAFIPRDFQPENALIDESFHFVGPTVDPDTHAEGLPFELSDSLPVVYVSLGTLHLGSTDFFHQCFEAFADLPAQVILSVGTQTDISALGAAPANVVVRQSVPQLEILQRAAVFVTHGGMNSVLEGLYYGVPLLLIPQQVEQLLIALNVAGRSAGLVLREHVAGKPVAAGDLRRDVERLMTEPRFGEAARAFQMSLRATGGYQAAADEIQKLTAGVGAR